MFGGAPPAADGKANAGPSFTNVSTMPLLTYMVLGGFTPIVENKRFEAVLAIQNNLNDPKAVGISGTDGKAPENYFTGVDWLDESSEWTGRELEVIEPWAKFLQGFQVNTNPKRPALDEYTQFFLKLPFAKKPITLPEPPPPKAKGSKKG